jgi:hypothetical protein
MDRVEQIEAIIDALPPEDFSRLARWFRERDQAAWDRQIEIDPASGKLDFLFDEADGERTVGLLRHWPTAE